MSTSYEEACNIHQKMVTEAIQKYAGVEETATVIQAVRAAIAQATEVTGWTSEALTKECRRRMQERIDNLQNETTKLR